MPSNRRISGRYCTKCRQTDIAPDPVCCIADIYDPIEFWARSILPTAWDLKELTELPIDYWRWNPD